MVKRGNSAGTGFPRSLKVGTAEVEAGLWEPCCTAVLSPALPKSVRHTEHVELAGWSLALRKEALIHPFKSLSIFHGHEKFLA